MVSVGLYPRAAATNANAMPVLAAFGANLVLTPGDIKGTMKRKIHSVSVEPKESPVITQKLAGESLEPGPHKIQGIGAGFIPYTLDLSIVDRVELVESAEAVEFARRLAREEGILCGISPGAAAAEAVRPANRGCFPAGTSSWSSLMQGSDTCPPSYSKGSTEALVGFMGCSSNECS